MVAMAMRMTMTGFRWKQRTSIGGTRTQTQRYIASAARGDTEYGGKERVALLYGAVDCKLSMGHDMESHPERAARLVAIEEELVKSGLTEQHCSSALQRMRAPDDMSTSSIASDDLLLRVHSQAYLRDLSDLNDSMQLALERAVTKGADASSLRPHIFEDSPTYATPSTLGLSIQAGHLACNMVGRTT